MKILFLIIPVVLITTITKAQPDTINQLYSNGKKEGKWTVYYNDNGKQINDSIGAIYYRYTWYNHGKDLYQFDWCSKDDQVISSPGDKQNVDSKLLHGEYKILDKKGVLKSVHVFDHGEYISIRNFYPTGELKEYCNFRNQHFVSGEFQPHSYCKRVYDKEGNAKYYYRQNPLTHGLSSFDDSDFDSTAVTNKRVVGDDTFATVTSYVGNQTRRQLNYYFFKQANGETRTVLHGDFTIWYPNGQIKEQGQYHHNKKKVGELKYSDGTEVKSEPDFDQLNKTNSEGKKTGWWITYLDKNLKVLKDSVGATHYMYNYYTDWFYHYNFSNLVGTKRCPIHFPASDSLQTGTYTLLNGDYISYYKSGIVRFVISTSNGILTEWKQYYPDGNLHWHAIYSTECGAPIHACVLGYDKNGKVTYDGAFMVPQDRRKYRNE